ncbi:uncharacterized protein MONOS_9977 [Monocercomonoides exilis]|uniref:uncharacterized protein n=1 Tax=Monocercomonoides exilis TaxID=2049356 RepID=UPI00355A2E91|nr:hypothetical protein MONOS_9977 [Monocercomonoides exilis]|eukprot:MONOS_9977.1-p1 / transcript=MONOS_9977.1 / gene=MONOS_9977 / organism=Monocercomonoides_exilis_PA203 / gene_product=unspecified product / transcript_product=unspecified product / location=Mono_scaffold00433:3319-5493(+) / protein_length=646 / sequence_SO=supercontig / SO=protein_coding / is_pseudo=false
MSIETPIQQPSVPLQNTETGTLKKSASRIADLVLKDADPTKGDKFWKKRLAYFLYTVFIFLLYAALMIFGILLKASAGYGLFVKLITIIGAGVICVFIIIGTIGFCFSKYRPAFQRMMTIHIVVQETVAIFAIYFGLYSLICGFYEQTNLIVDSSSIGNSSSLHLLGDGLTDSAKQIIKNRNMYYCVSICACVCGLMTIFTPLLAKPIVGKRLFHQSFGISSSLIPLILAAIHITTIFIFPFGGQIDASHFELVKTIFMWIFVGLGVVECAIGIFSLVITLASSCIEKLRWNIRYVEGIFQVIVVLVEASYVVVNAVLLVQGKQYRAPHLIEYYFLTNYAESMCGGLTDAEKAMCSKGLSTNRLRFLINIFWNKEMIIAALFSAYTIASAFQIIGYSGYIATSFGKPKPQDINKSKSDGDDEDDDDDFDSEDDDSDDESTEGKRTKTKSNKPIVVSSYDSASPSSSSSSSSFSSSSGVQETNLDLEPSVSPHPISPRVLSSTESEEDAHLRSQVELTKLHEQQKSQHLIRMNSMANAMSPRGTGPAGSPNGMFPMMTSGSAAQLAPLSLAQNPYGQALPQLSPRSAQPLSPAVYMQQQQQQQQYQQLQQLQQLQQQQQQQQQMLMMQQNQMAQDPMRGMIVAEYY